LIGVTFCPGKKDPAVLADEGNRDLERDLDAVATWGADLVVSLLEEHEFSLLAVEVLPRGVTQRGMHWMHMPIRDCTAPDGAFELAWRGAGPQLRRLIRRGGRVLVHCRGGLGRAGTVAARLLVELGMEPEPALGAVRRARPGAIGMREQEAHVRACHAIADDPRSGDAGPTRDRAIGCLLGLAVGDAIGATLEFAARDSKPRLADMVGGGPFGLRPGEWTDDTSMALCLADSLLARGRLDQRDLMERFVRWWREGENSVTGQCFDIGATTKAALTHFCDTGNPVSGPSGARSAGNGSIMRLAPVVLRWIREPIVAIRAARAQSVITHAAPAAVEGCALLAEVLLEAVETGSKPVTLRPRRSAEPAIDAVAKGAWRGKRRDEVPSSGYVVHTLEAALWSLDQASSFEEAVLLASNLGDDADTVAAVTGQIAGALWGRSAIPGKWLERLAWRDKIEDRANRLLDAKVIEQDAAARRD
jgi:ADP-ribosyl-[dinitrogen reductase] hydrolase